MRQPAHVLQELRLALRGDREHVGERAPVRHAIARVGAIVLVILTALALGIGLYLENPRQQPWEFRLAPPEFHIITVGAYRRQLLIEYHHTMWSTTLTPKQWRVIHYEWNWPTRQVFHFDGEDRLIEPPSALLPEGVSARQLSLAIPATAFWALFVIGCAGCWRWVVRRPLRRWLRLRAGRCMQCGYSLVGNVTGRCPECGAAAGRRPSAEKGENRSGDQESGRPDGRERRE